MKLSKYMWEIWQYAAYGEKKTGSGVGVGIDMMHATSEPERKTIRKPA